MQKLLLRETFPSPKSIFPYLRKTWEIATANGAAFAVAMYFTCVKANLKLVVARCSYNYKPHHD